MEKQHYIYTKEDYQKVHDLVYEYQNGNVEAGEEIINSFSAFLSRYVSLLHYGYFDLKHSSIRSFIKLYIENPVKRSSVTSYNHNNGAGRLAAQETVDMIKSYFANLDKEDIIQGIHSIFLLMASKYKDTKPSFQHYVDKNFHFYVFRNFEKMTRDPLNRNTCTSLYVKTQANILGNEFEINLGDNIKDLRLEIELEDLEEEVSIQQSINKADVTPLGQMDCTKSEKVSRYDDSFLDINWINGITCSEVFKTLTTFERRILVMWYIEKKTDMNIAENFGVCRGTINNKRAKAKQKLESELKRLNLVVK